MIARRQHCCRARSACLWAFTLCVWALPASCPAPALAQARKPAKYQVYELQHKRAAEVEPLLVEMLEEFGDGAHLVVDAKSNRLLLRGPEKAQRITEKVLKSIDQPASAHSSKPAGPIVRSYAVPAEGLAASLARLRRQFGGTAGVRIGGDPSGKRIIVLAPPDVQTELASLLIPETKPAATARRPAEPRARKTAPQPAPVERTETPPEIDETPALSTLDAPEPEPTAEVETAANATRFIPLVHTETGAAVQLLRELIGPGLQSRDKTLFQISNAVGEQVELRSDNRQHGFWISGDSRLSVQIVRLLGCLDVTAQEGQPLTRVMAVHAVKPEIMRRAIDAYRNERGDRQSLGEIEDRAPRGKAHLKSKPADSHFADERSSGIRLVGNQEPAGDAAGAAPPPGTPPAANGELPEDEAADLRQRLRQLGTELEVEILPDLDVIILRGNKRDVREMTRILKEIERLSAETEPSIEVYPLKHVRGDSLATLLEKVNPDLVGGTRGRVSVTPLVQPNSLLLIGWGEAVKSVRELIEKLDQPVPPDAEFQVFRLKHADAQTARMTFQELFQAKTGLAPKVQATPDVRTNSLIVQAAPRDMLEAARLIEQIDVPHGEVVNQARIFKLRNTLAVDLAAVLQAALDSARSRDGGGGGPGGAQRKSAQLEFLSIDTKGQQILKSGILGDVKITPEPRTNSLLVAASPESMDLVGALIRELDDAPREGAQIKVFQIVNGDATSLVQMLRAMLPPPSVQAGLPQLANARDESSLVPTRFAVDQRTNSIIATGPIGDLMIIEALLLRLDEKDIAQRKNIVYRLKNAPANPVAKSINDFLRSERSVQQAAPGQVSPFQQIESEVVVVPEPVGNSLIISATPRFFDEILKMVEKLDAQPPQVMIQVLIAQVNLQDTNEFGVELGLQDGLLFDRSLLGSLVTTTSTAQASSPSGILTSTQQNIIGASNTPGFNFNNQPLGNSGAARSLATAPYVAGQGLSNFNLGRTNSDLGYGGLVLSASSENVSILIRALQQSNRLEVLSKPQIRTLDNQPAYIQIGQRVPRISSAAVNNIGQVNGIVLENVGLILGVTPRISPDGMVVMEVDAEKSDVGPASSGIPVSISASGAVINSPIFNITTASTTVSANSGETIIIGGLITKSDQEEMRRVPYLSDIPILGNFFRYDSVNVQRSELLIILTPHVIRGPEDSERLKRAEVARMHWCASDVIDVYGSGIIEEDPRMYLDAEIPVIYPDANPRGIIVPAEPIPESASEPLPAPALPIPPRPPEGPADDSDIQQMSGTAESVPKRKKKRKSTKSKTAPAETPAKTKVDATTETKKDKPGWFSNPWKRTSD